MLQEPINCKRLVGETGSVHYVLFRGNDAHDVIALVPGYEMERMTQQYKEEERKAKEKRR